MALHAIVKDRLDAALAGVQLKSGLTLTYGEDVLAAFAVTLQDAKYGVREIDSLLYEKLSPALAAVSTPVHRTREETDSYRAQRYTHRPRMKSEAPPAIREPVLMTALRLSPENATRLLASPAPTPSTTPSRIGIAIYRIEDTS